MNRRSAALASRRGFQLARRMYQRDRRGAAVFPDEQARAMGTSSSPRAQRAIRSLKALT